MKHAKVVESPHHHLWSDALHGRALAHQALNDWDRGTYVRWTVMTAWTALEMACGDALGVNDLGMRFKDNLNKAILDSRLSPIDWSSGIWQRVKKLQSTRKNYVHINATENDLFPSVSTADEAIAVVRAAIVDIYGRTSKTVPQWVDDDSDRGFHTLASGSAYGSVIGDGVDPDANDTIRIAYVHEGNEYVHAYLPAGTDPVPHLEALIHGFNVPVSVVRAYRGTSLLIERKLHMRGA